MLWLLSMPSDRCEDHRITRTPSSQSCHEFSEAIGPVLDKYLSEIEHPEEKSDQTRIFLARALSHWFEVWPIPKRIADSQGRIRVLKKELGKSILHGRLGYVFKCHTAERAGAPLAYPYPHLNWQEALDQAVRDSGFERWADKAYVQELRTQRRSEYAREKKDFERFINPPGVGFYGKTPDERFEKLLGAYWWLENDFPHVRDFLEDEEEEEGEDNNDDDNDGIHEF
ncbi:hypothetical protein PM082_023640 [Marasmius tenuissimus]|nr:hypothetical protein PM082_023640 [Marasmius tenuissimus]